jgi:hypothetical protein
MCHVLFCRMPMDLHHWPSEEELGPYYQNFLGYCISWAVAEEFFGGERWFSELEEVAWRGATHLDGVVDMCSFFETFHFGIPYMNWEASRIIATHRWF